MREDTTRCGGGSQEPRDSESSQAISPTRSIFIQTLAFIRLADKGKKPICEAVAPDQTDSLWQSLAA